MNKAKELRLQQGKTRIEIATEAGMTERYLIMIEKGECNPSLKKLQGLAKALGVEVKDLI